MKAVITPKLIKIEFCSLYVFGQFFSKESNDVILFEIQELFFFKKKLRGAGVDPKKIFLYILSPICSNEILRPKLAF